jgi:hypothetical protein
MPDIHRTGRLRSRAARVAGVSLLAVTAVAGTSLAPAAGALIERWNGRAWSVTA